MTDPLDLAATQQQNFVLKTYVMMMTNDMKLYDIF
jgi:hypothetical protein